MTRNSTFFFALRWAAAYAVTECAAVVAASLVLAMTWQLVVLCALFEGAVLGLLQGLLLHGSRGRLVLNWTLATAAGVLLGRFIEYGADVSPWAAAIIGLPAIVQIVAGVALGAVVGGATGSVQALQLRGKVAHPLGWIAVCSAAWALALPALLFVGAATARLSALPLWQSASLVLGAFVAVGALAGAIEGTGLGWMLRMMGRDRNAAAPVERPGRTTRPAAGLVHSGS